MRQKAFAGPTWFVLCRGLSNATSPGFLHGNYTYMDMAEGVKPHFHTANEGPVRIQNKYVWFPFMYSQEWICVCSLVISKQNYNVLSPRFIYFRDRSVYFAASKYVDQSWEYINRSQTHEWRIWDLGRASPFPGIHKFDVRYSACTMRISIAVLPLPPTL
jgi:hypothetical protein